ncbi:MAG: hydantoinase/oxoprolinase family protein [Pseudomonadota bacterium]
MSRYLIGVDVGGTFTDVFLLDRETGRVATAKTPTTLDDQSRGFIAGIAALVQDFGAIAGVVHGTTTGTNALLERGGARTGIITTEGFRDVLEMRRRDRPTTWGLWGGYEPVVPRNLRLETPERVLADGRVLQPIDPADIGAKARALREAGCEAVCLFFINAYANDANEQAALAALKAVWPNPHVTAAAEILPEIREFERLSTATLNAYLQPLVSSYLDRLDRALAGRGAAADLLIVQSNGGVMTVETASRQPVRTALSGPAAGVTAAAAIARAAGYPNIITCDMGGTSFDVSLVADGRAALMAESAVDFGLTIRMPMVEITTIGAGGGSIASVDASGLLQVGPASAGSHPGPACYGQGGARPTVTDANLLLGRINPDRPIGGALERLDVAASEAAVAEHVGRPLGLDAHAAAEAILRVANTKMAGAIRLVSIERGHDPAKFAAMPFGGGGALHTGALMQEVGLGAAVIPRFPGVTSALGCIVADMRHDRVQTVNAPLAAADFAALRAAFAALEETLTRLIAESGAVFEGIEIRRSFDMLYEGQTHTVAVPLEMAPDALDAATARAAFDAAYRAAYGRLLEGAAARIVNLRLAAIGRRPDFDMSVFAPADGRAAAACKIGERVVYVAGRSLTAPVYDRLALAVGERIAGPAILEQPDTTIFIDPGLAGSVDGTGNLVLQRTG